MTENEAITEVRFNMSTIGLNENATKRVIKARNMAINALYEIQQYRAIGTVEELQALKEKSVAKKPIEIRCGCYSITKGGHKEYVIINKCPNCGSEELMNSFPCRCGQKLDWQ